MKIIYLHQYFVTPQMPGGTRSYEMARRLVKWGHEVHMITSKQGDIKNKNGWEKTVENGINVYWYPEPYSNKMGFKDRIQAFVKFAYVSAQKAVSLDGDIIFATSTPLTIALPGIYAKKRKNIPMVFEVRDLWPEVPISMEVIKNKIFISMSRWLEQYAYKNSEQIVALSKGMKRGIIQTGYPINKVHVIPNSSDNDLFDIPKKKGIGFRNKHSWLRERPLVVYTGTHGKVNGIDYLVKLAKATMNLDSEIRFLTVGDGGEWQKVKELAKEEGVLNKNFFMKKSVPKTEIPIILSAADVATSLVVNNETLWANSANKFFDGLASGTTFAVNHGGWQAELLEKEEAGFMLHPTDLDRAAKDLIERINNEKWLETTSKNAKRLALERFDRDKLANKLMQVLDKAVDNYEKGA